MSRLVPSSRRGGSLYDYGQLSPESPVPHGVAGERFGGLLFVDSFSLLIEGL